MRTAFVIDGFNFYHSIKNLPKHLRWFDYAAYCRHFLTRHDTIDFICYCTALAWFRPEAAARHEVFLKACHLNGIHVILGQFKKKDMDCPHCHNHITRHEEKETDVNIALTAYRLAAKTEQVFLVSGDSDLAPVIRAIKWDFPKVRVGVIFPFRRFTRELKNAADITHKPPRKILDQFVLPLKINKADGSEIICPANWGDASISNPEL